MPSNRPLDLTVLAPIFASALKWLGELGQPGIDAVNDYMATRSDCPDFNTRFDLLDGWIDNDP